jgi:biotin/methionine sulfoxide reductase
MARHADIVLPASMTLERNDIGGSPNDACLIAMRQAVPPWGEGPQRLCNLRRSRREPRRRPALHRGPGRDGVAAAPLRRLARRVTADGGSVPPFDDFWAAGFLEASRADDDLVLFKQFRADPEGKPLGTPSGRIEIFSATIDGFGYADCPGHPTWLEPSEWLGAPLAGRYPLHLIASNPTARLHSQLDVGAVSQDTKVQGREPIRIHPADAAARGVANGDVVRVWNDRGSCLAGAVVSDTVRPRVVQLSTGAWYDPLDPADPDTMCVHGNPNVLTFDRGTSRLAQACSGQHALVEVERWTGPLPPIRAYDPLAMDRRPDR